MYYSDFILMHRLRAAKKHFLASNMDKAAHIMEKTIEGFHAGTTNLSPADTVSISELMDMTYFMVVLHAAGPAEEHLNALMAALRTNVKKTSLMVKRLRNNKNTSDSLGALDVLPFDLREVLIRKL